jgi:hypothetical protein
MLSIQKCPNDLTLTADEVLKAPSAPPVPAFRLHRESQEKEAKTAEEDFVQFRVERLQDATGNPVLFCRVVP